MKNLKRSLVSLTETYLRNFPVPADIALYTSALKLSYSFSSPFTNSKSTFETFYNLPLASEQPSQLSESISRRMNFVQAVPQKTPSRIQLTNSFNSIANLPHEKVIQDAVFGKAQKAQNAEKWVYIAKLKEDKHVSIFGGEEIAQGNGKAVFRGDFGETYEGTSKVGIFVWDVEKKKIYHVETDDDIIPASPKFSDADGNKILFHAYRRQEFAFGLVHCFNRPIDIYQATYQVEETEKQTQSKGKKTFKKETVVKTEVRCLKFDMETNIFPNISPCFNYLIFFQGKGITHTFYLDLVIMKRKESSWVQSHRIKEKFIGYYDTFQSHFMTKGNGKENGEKTYLFTQTLEDSCQKIYMVDLESGEIENFTKNSLGTSYAITQCVNNMLLGVFTSHQERSFFYTLPDSFEIRHIQPFKGNKFQGITIKEFNQPIHGFLLQADQTDPNFEHNRPKKERPLIINIHGGPHGATNPVLTLEKYLMLKAGYTILLPNATGSAGFGNDYLLGAIGHPASKNAKEIIDLMNKVLKEHPELSPERVHLIGGSYGGYMTAYLGSHFEKFFKSGVIMNGVLSIAGQLWYTDIPEWSTVQGAGHDRFQDISAQDYGRMLKESPVEKPMKIPTLQLLGAKDRRVPHRQGFLYEAISKKYGTSFETHVYENSNHSLADSVETSIDCAMKVMMFYERENWKEENADENQKKQ